MPAIETAPEGALTAIDIVLWLGQVADDGDLSPIASRAAAKLAQSFMRDQAPVAILYDDMARTLGVGRNTAVRALSSLRRRGHLAAASGGRGRILAYRPVLAAEGRK